MVLPWGATTRTPKSLNGATAGREAPTVNAKSRNGLGGKGKPRPISEAKKSPQSEWGPVSKKSLMAGSRPKVPRKPPSLARSLWVYLWVWYPLLPPKVGSMDHGPNRKAPTRSLYHDGILASVTLASLDSRKGKMPRRFVRLENAGAVGNEIRHPNAGSTVSQHSRSSTTSYSQLWLRGNDNMK